MTEKVSRCVPAWRLTLSLLALEIKLSLKVQPTGSALLSVQPLNCFSFDLTLKDFIHSFLSNSDVGTGIIQIIQFLTVESLQLYSRNMSHRIEKLSVLFWDNMIPRSLMCPVLPTGGWDFKPT